MPSYYVSTPKWTVRVDVAQDRIQPTTARYLHRCYGQSWTQQRQYWQRIYGARCQIVQLPTELEDT